jgi:hypothetical protein
MVTQEHPASTPRKIDTNVATSRETLPFLTPIVREISAIENWKTEFKTSLGNKLNGNLHQLYPERNMDTFK